MVSKIKTSMCTILISSIGIASTPISARSGVALEFISESMIPFENPSPEIPHYARYNLDVNRNKFGYEFADFKKYHKSGKGKNKNTISQLPNHYIRNQRV